MNSRILNIVKFTVTDQVGDHKTNWNQAAIFYRDVSLKMVSISEYAKESKIIVKVPILISVDKLLKLQLLVQKKERNLQNSRKVLKVLRLKLLKRNLLRVLRALKKQNLILSL